MTEWQQADTEASPHVVESWTARADGGRMYAATLLKPDIHPDGTWELTAYDVDGRYVFGCDCSTLDDAKRLVDEWEAGPGVQP